MSIPATLDALTIPIGDLRPYGKNPRRGNVELIAESLQRNGQYRPVVANRRTGEVLAGNHTLAAARSLGWSELAVTWVDVDDEAAARIALVDNRASDLAGFDDQVLADLLGTLPDLAGTGYSDQDLADLLSKVTELPPVLADPDAVPALPQDPTTVLGDVWVLGPHRVTCGDSTDVAVWDSILGTDRPALVFTDPPYGIGYKAIRGGDAIANDADANEALAVARDALTLLADVDTHFVCCDWRSMPTMFDAMISATILPKACIVWDKERRVQNLDRYAKQHEFILYAGPYGGQPTVDTDIWPCARDFDPDHPTPKPVALIEKALTTASTPGALVADPFAGSGSTLIAAQVTGRVARVVELDPRYVDVICRRYQEISGDKPILESTGEPHDFTRDPA